MSSNKLKTIFMIVSIVSLALEVVCELLGEKNTEILVEEKVNEILERKHLV